MTGELRDRVARASSDEGDAWVAWSVIAEAADDVAGWLVQSLGPVRALAWVADVAEDPVGASMVLAGLGTPRDIDHAVRASERWARRSASLDVDEVRERSRRCGARLVVRGDAEWPVAVEDLDRAAPFALWARGDGDLRALGTASVAIVGARASTAYGDHVAATIAGDVAMAGRAVVSGGAYGIDAAAHRGALAAGGTTVAVMAGGVDRPYPAGNADLLDRVMRSGLLVSESPPGWAPHRSRFLSRNRLIACAGVTVVVEAAHRSGALSTAAHAQAMVRPVAAVPGPVTSAGSAGCHRIVRAAEAVLVTSAADVLELVAPLTDPQHTERPEEAPGAEGWTLEFAGPADRAAFDALGKRTRGATGVAETAGLTLAEVRAAMGRMEAAGHVERDGDGWRRVRRSRS
ncbi:DNA-processing protein DprA [Demequina sp. NBRC 110056]|uniref:DNA-processing protein DprA n=1 Tax=Demequina sp. NBRC 110056 TaxID=1570345 RepID=UPI001F1F3E2F|nr:DNA-processing protein DprA [Demequina sp. NBRC 110056]